MFALPQVLAALTPAFTGEWLPCAAAAHHPGLPEAAVFAWGMLEVRLAPGPFEVDVLGCVLQPHGGVGSSFPALERARATLDAAARRQLPQAWFEWDQRGDPERPLVWWGVDPATGNLPPLHPDAEEGFLHALLRAGGPADPRVLRAASTIRAAARGHGRILGVGWLRSRGIERARVFVEVGRGALRAFLGAVGWPGDLDLAETWWDRAIPPWEPGFLQLELGPDVCPYLGLEPRQTRQGFGNRVHHERWLASLVDAGLAHPARCAALLAWSSPFETGAGPILRSFHTKLVTDGNAITAAKAYLGFTTRPGA